MLTKEQLKEWKKKGYSYEKIAELAGVSDTNVAYCMRKYGLTNGRKLTLEEKQLCRKLGESGYNAAQIAEKVGHAYSTVYHILKAAGLITDRKVKWEQEREEENPIFIPRELTFAKKRKPRIITIICDGKRYQDITDYWIPY